MIQYQEIFLGPYSLPAAYLIWESANIKKSNNGTIFTGHHAHGKCEVITAQGQVMYREFHRN